MKISLALLLIILQDLQLFYFIWSPFKARSQEFFGFAVQDVFNPLGYDYSDISIFTAVVASLLAAMVLLFGCMTYTFVSFSSGKLKVSRLMLGKVKIRCRLYTRWSFCGPRPFSFVPSA
jgi:hypothetical protein